LGNLNLQVQSKENQLDTIIDRYKQFIQITKRRHRRGLLL